MLDAVTRASTKDTRLTGWFILNRVDPSARQYLYVQIPLHYTWKQGQWCARKKGGPKVLGRIFNISPRQEELFYLRLLLLHIRGAQSFEELYTHDRIRHSTFKSVCIARGLALDDQVWFRTMREAAAYQMPTQLRQLFVTILSFNNVSDPLALWDQFKGEMCEDFMHQYQGHSQQIEFAVQKALAHLEELFRMIGKSCESYGLPVYMMVVGGLHDGSLRSRAQNDQFASQNIPLLNTTQKKIFDVVVAAVLHGSNDNCFFIDGPAGTGKTFLISVRILN